jgi:DNA invertase Pin-like site-specific DNA recombinase
MKAFIYLRVSTEKQHKSGLGLEAQRTSCMKAANQLGATEIIIHQDPDDSGGAEIENRPGLTRILNEIGKGDVMIAAKRDRVARELRLIYTVEWKLTLKKATFISAAGEGSGLAPDDASGIMLRGISDIFAQVERVMISTRTRDALRVKASKGERVGSIPYGCLLHEDGVHLVELPAEQEVIRIVKDLGTGLKALPMRRIAAFLDENSILSRSGKPWQAMQISRILKRNAS